MPRQRVAVLHTSFVFINVEPVLLDLFAELVPDAELVHFVDSDVLATVMREGEISPASTSRMRHLAEAAQDAGADVIFSACSSLGPAVEPVRETSPVPVLRIDDAMAEAAVGRATEIGVLATVPSTLAPTADLIERKAAERGKQVRTHKQLCEGGFDVLMAGDRDRHDEIVVEGARDLARRSELIVLAQASMARMAPLLEREIGLEVLSSPRLGIESVRDLLEPVGPRSEDPAEGSTASGKQH